MNFRKISMLGLTACALLFTSCGAKEISYEDATKHIKDTYTGDPFKTPKKLIQEVKYIAHNEVTKKFIKENVPNLNDDLYFKEETTTGLFPMPICTVESLQHYTDCKFYLSGKELTLKAKIETITPVGKKSGEQTVTWNSEGYLRESASKGEFKDGEIDYYAANTAIYEY